MNKTVTATGLKVQARAEGGIVIARTGTERASATDTASISLDSAQKLLPTSTSNASTWFHAEAASSSNYAAQVNTMRTLTLTQTAPGASAIGTKYPSGSADSVYVLYDTYTVYPDKNSASFVDLWVSGCTVTTTEKDLSKSLRVAIVCGSNVIICAPVYTSATDDTVVSYTVGTNPDGTTAAGTTVKALKTAGTYSTLLTKAVSGDNKNILVADGTSTGTSGVVVNVFVYFEGEDTNHTTDNLNIGTEAITVTVKLSCTSVASSGS